MKIEIVVRVVEPEFIDLDHEMGLTNEGFEMLTDALANAGFEIEEGPEQVSAP